MEISNKKKKEECFPVGMSANFWHFAKSKLHFYYINILMRQYKVVQGCPV